MSKLVGQEHSFMTVDGFEVTHTDSGRDSHGSQCRWSYFNGHIIDGRIARKLSEEHRCFPHKFVSMPKLADEQHRFKCVVCNKETTDFSLYYEHQGHSEERYKYPSINKVDLPENQGRVFDSVALVAELSK